MSSLDAESYEFLRNGLQEPAEFELQCSKFVDRMRHASSFELVQRMKSFINDFVGVQSSGSAKQSSQMIKNFIEEMSQLLREHPLWKEDGEDEFNWAIEALEKYLMTKLFKLTYYLPSTTDTEDDEKFYYRTRIFQFLKPKHFDIPDRPLNRIATEIAAEELARIDSDQLKSPQEKLTCILNCISILSNLLKHYGEEQGTGADDLLPYLIYTIILLSPKQMHSNLRFISRYRRDSQMRSEAAYYFTQMESAVMFIKEADHKNLSISEEEFKQGVEKADQLIQSGLDISSYLPRSHSFRPRIPSVLRTPPSSPSPMLSRRTSVMEEWSQLQRKRSLSKSDRGQSMAIERGHASCSKELTDTRTDSTFPLHSSSSMGTEKGGEQESDVDAQITMIGKAEMMWAESTDVSTSLSTNGDLVVVQKFMTTKFEELTVAELKQIYSCYQHLAKKYYSGDLH